MCTRPNYKAFFPWNQHENKQDRQYAYKRNIEAPSCSNFCSAKAISSNHSECVFVALMNQNAMRMRHIFTRSLSGPAILYHIISFFKFFKESYWTQNVCFDFLYTFVWNILHSKKNCTRYDQTSVRSACKVSVIFCQILMTFEFFDIFSKKIFTSNFMKIRSVTAELFHSEGRTDGQLWRS